MTSPGWYPDPAGTGQQRYFDGGTWTANYAPAVMAPAAWTPAPVQAPKTTPAVWLGVAALVIAIVVGIIVWPHVKSSVTDPHPSASASVGQHVSDGKFDFVISKVEQLKWVGTPGPRGVFIVATMTVTNTGNEAQSFFTQNQKLIDTAGRSYAADTEFALSMNPDAMVIDMNPGFGITVKVPFDVPPGTEVDKIEVHDSAFSAGTAVMVDSVPIT